MRLIDKDDNLFIICGKDVITSEKKYPCYVPETTFNKVEKFIQTVPDINNLLVQDKKGNVEYWERDIHAKIVDLLVILMPFDDERDISNSLTALGF